MPFSAFRRSARSLFSFAHAGIARSSGRALRHARRTRRMGFGPVNLSTERLEGRAVLATTSGVAIAGETGGIISGTTHYLNVSDVVNFTATMSSPVTVTGSPQLTINLGGFSRQAMYDQTTSTATSLIFRYTIQADDNDTNGISIGANQLSSNGGSISDTTTGTPATLTHSAVADDPNYKVDTTAPLVNAVAITSATGIQNSTLTASDVVSATVTMSEPVTVTGTPQLALNVGGVSRTASYDSSSSTPTALVFKYTILAGDTDANGISVTANSLATAGGRTIADAAGNAATLSHPAVTDNAGFLVDTTAPNAPPAPSEQGSSKLSDGFLDYVECLTPTTFRLGLGTSGAVNGDTIEVLIGGSSFSPPSRLALTPAISASATRTLP